MDADGAAVRRQEPTEGSGVSSSKDQLDTGAQSGPSLFDDADRRTAEASASTSTSATASVQQTPRSRRGARPDVGGTKGATVLPAGDQGSDFERRVARLEFAEGALARLRVPVFVDAEAGRDQLTDLDVLALDFDNRLRVSRSILECKSGRSQSGEGDRLLWLAGLQSMLHVDRAVLVRQTITRRGQAIASALRLQILDNATLSQRESAHAWLPERFAHIDGPACVSAETRMDTQLKGLGHIPSDLVAFLRFNSLLAPAHRGLAMLVELGGVIDDGGVLPHPTRTLLAGHALQALAIAALQDAAMLDTVPADTLRRRTELALTVGTPDDDHLLSVLGLADQIMERVVESLHREYTQQGADRVQSPAPSLRQSVGTPPHWIDRYLDLIQRLRASPAIARQLPQTLELACFDALLHDAAFHAAAFDHLFTPEHRSLVTGCVRMLKEIVSESLADALIPITELDFNRRAPALPDRAAKPDASTPATTPPQVVRRTD